MLSYCLSCRKKSESKNPKVLSTKNGRIMLLSKCAVFDSRKLKFIKEKDARVLLSNLAIIKTQFLSNLSMLNTIL